MQHRVDVGQYSEITVAGFDRLGGALREGVASVSRTRRGNDAPLIMAQGAGGRSLGAAGIKHSPAL